MATTTSKPGRWVTIRRWMLLVVLLAILAGVGYLLYSIIAFSWPIESGFGDYNSPATAAEKKFERAKTLWDWMQLLVIPLVLAIAAFFLNRTERIGAEKAAEQRAKTERELAERRAKTEREIAEQRAEQERQIAEQRALDAVLEMYLDRMTELLIDKKLKSQPTQEVRDIARVRTLTTLQRLDGAHKVISIQFLDEAQLINGSEAIVILAGANLKGVDLGYTQLDEVCLAYTDLRDAVLAFAVLKNADLRGARLQGANLHGTNLSGANLQGANLQGANLLYADLQGATVTNEQLLTARSLQGATMPDGSKHE